jgi:ElaB/YqjD/DUF883 family membrane-anchored ribosome-binding protein
VSKDTDQARQEVQAARARLRSTVGELGTAVQETRAEVVAKVRKATPMAAGTVGAIVLVNLLRRRRR